MSGVDERGRCNVWETTLKWKELIMKKRVIARRMTIIFFFFLSDLVVMER